MMDKNNNSKTSQFVFAILLAIFSLDFGFVKFKSSRLSVLAKSICAIQTLSINILIVYFNKYGNPLFQAWFCLNIIEQCLLVFVLLFTNKSTFSKFCHDLSSIDKQLGIEVSPKPELIIAVWTGINLIYRCIVQHMYCVSLNDYCSPYLNALLLVPIVCADVFLIVYFFIYYLLYFRFKVFTSFVRKDNADIVACQSLYITIAVTADAIKSVYNALYVGVLVIHITDMMITVFYPLLGNDLPMPVNFTSAIQKAFMVFSPAIAAGLLSSQVNQLRVVLHDKLFQERELKQIFYIKRFVRYIEVRPLRTTIWKVIPLDWQLPVIIINICVTYLIVILQFSHKY